MTWRKKRHLRRREDISKEHNGMLKALSCGEKPRFVYWKSSAGRKHYVPVDGKKPARSLVVHTETKMTSGLIYEKK